MDGFSKQTLAGARGNDEVAPGLRWVHVFWAGLLN
jgi:hypothetical protein